MREGGEEKEREKYILFLIKYKFYRLEQSIKISGLTIIPSVETFLANI